MKEDFEWVVKVIDSCCRTEHLAYIPGILKLFDRKHSATYPGESRELKRLYARATLRVVNSYEPFEG